MKYGRRKWNIAVGQMDFSGRGSLSRPVDKQRDGGISRGQIIKERVRRFPA